MITSYDCKRGRYVVTTLDENQSLKVEKEFSDVEELPNSRFVFSYIYHVFSGSIVDRLAEYEKTGYEPQEVAKLAQNIRVLESRLKHLLQSDFINTFDRKDPITKEYTRDIKEADKLLKCNSVEMKKINLLIQQLSPELERVKRENAELKRLLRLAVGEITKQKLYADLGMMSRGALCKSCKTRSITNRVCQVCNYEYEYAEEAMKLLGDEDNEQ